MVFSKRWKRRKTTSSAFFCATGVWGLSDTDVACLIFLTFKFSRYPSATPIAITMTLWTLFLRSYNNLISNSWIFLCKIKIAIELELKFFRQPESFFENSVFVIKSKALSMLVPMIVFSCSIFEIFVKKSFADIGCFCDWNDRTDL